MKSSKMKSISGTATMAFALFMTLVGFNPELVWGKPPGEWHIPPGSWSWTRSPGNPACLTQKIRRSCTETS